MLREFGTWWVDQMRGLGVSLARQRGGRMQDAVILSSGDLDGWRVTRRRRGVLTPIATLGADADRAAWSRAMGQRRRGEAVVIALRRAFLRRRETVPAAAAAHLDRLLRYEMDRLTPFAAADVLFDHRIVARDPASGALTVDIAVAPKSWAAAPLAHLAALGIAPSAIEAPDPAGGVARIAITSEDQTRSRTGLFVALIVCAMLALAVLAVPLLRQSLALAAVEERLAVLKPAMDQVDATRRRIAAGSAGMGRVAAAHERAAAVPRLLGVLTDLLPDDTYLTSLALRRDRLTMEGQSATATRLIASMAAEPHVKNPSFAAPVVRAESGRDVFTIQAGFEP